MPRYYPKAQIRHGSKRRCVKREGHRSHAEAVGSLAQICSVCRPSCTYRVMAKSASRVARMIQMLMRISACPGIVTSPSYPRDPALGALHTHTLGRGSRCGARGRLAVAAPPAGQATLDFSCTLQSEPVARRAVCQVEPSYPLNAFAMRVPKLWAGFSFWRMTRGSLARVRFDETISGLEL